MTKKKNEFDLERIEYAQYHKTLERQLLPYFRRALKKNVQPSLDLAKSIGTNFIPVIDSNIWTDVYIEVFNLVGQKTARKEYYRQRNLESIEIKESAIDIFRDVWSRILNQYAYEYVYKIQNSLNQRTIEIIQSALNESNQLGLDQDGSVRLFERLINGKLRLRSLTFARTEATTISNLGKKIGATSWIDEQGGGGYKAWLGRNDARERETHLEENNTIIPIDDLHDVGGSFCQHPGDTNLPLDEKINCYLPNTKIESNIIGGQKSFYSGQVCEIITVGGERLTVTPNHEILTINGFVKAKDLTNSDYVLSNTEKRNFFSSLLDNYIYNKPSTAADIFSSISILWGSQKIMSSALDFDGDALFMDNNIDIVDANIELPINGIEMYIKSVGKFLFKPTASQTSLIERFCCFEFGFDRMKSSSNSYMRFLNLSFSLRFRHLRPFKFLSIGRVSNLNASRFKFSNKGYTDDSTFIAELFHRDAAKVSIDKVLEVRNFFYSGHVYDFSSLNGVNIANNIYTSNCRCTETYMSANRYNQYLKRGRIVGGKLVGAS